MRELQGKSKNIQVMNILSRFKFICLVTGLMILSLAIQAGPFFVVVGTFTKEEAARKFATTLRQEYAESPFTFDHDKNVYHVHVMETNRFVVASAFRNKVRHEAGFAGAWIFADFQSGTSASSEDAGGSPVELQLYTGSTVLLSSADNSILSISKQARPRQTETGERSAAKGAAGDLPMTFVARTLSGQEVTGNVVMLKHGRELSTFKTKEIVSLGGKQDNPVFTLVCHVKGFSPEVRVVDLNEVGSLPGVYLNDDGVWEIRFDVVRMKVDEVPLLYHKLFYENASVLHEESEDQIDLIANVMKDNTRSTIFIDSHCNALSNEKIQVPGKAKRYFDISDAVEKSGSPKSLTKSRAEVLRDCLVARGIDERRITVMGWGDLDPLVRGAEADVSMNERIEVRLVNGD